MITKFTKYNESSHINNVAIEITDVNSVELKDFYNHYEDFNKTFSWGYYMIYDFNQQRFRFSMNKSKLNVVKTLDEFIGEFEKTNSEIEKFNSDTENMDYWDRIARVKELAEMDNKPWSDVNSNY